jgi:hypothetical protein
MRVHPPEAEPDRMTAPVPTRLSKLEEWTVDDAIRAYVEWREVCATVWNAYQRWSRASADEASVAYGVYVAALDREDVAATRYGESMRRVGEVVAAA